MSRKRLNFLSLTSVEHELLSSLDYENVIEYRFLMKNL